MCIIIYTPNGDIPINHLEESLKRNPDGYGYVFPDIMGRMVVRKGLSPESFFKVWEEDKDRRKSRPLVFHSRIATSGLVSRPTCHPFRVGKSRIWVAHNGVLSKHTVLNSNRSDTMHFVEDILEQLPEGWFDNAAIHDLIEDYIGASKMVFMDGLGRVVISNAKAGSWHKKRWYSNESWRPTPKVYTYKQPPMGFNATPPATTAYKAKEESEYEEDGWYDEDTDIYYTRFGYYDSIGNFHRYAATDQEHTFNANLPSKSIVTLPGQQDSDVKIRVIAHNRVPSPYKGGDK